MKGFKVVTVIFSLVFLASLFIPLIVGCTFDATTLYWIEITGYNLLDQHPASLLMLTTFALTLLMLLIQWSKKLRVLWVLVLTGVGGWAYVISLTTAWNTYRQFTEDISLNPGCVLPPMMILLVANAVIAAIWTETDNHE